MKVGICAAIAAIGIALSGCATIVDGSTQSVSVSTAPVQGAACTLTNSEGTWFVTSPGNAVVHKTKSDLTVTCKKNGFRSGSQVAVSKFGGATFGNIVLGGGVGAIVDAASGANYYYDSPLIVPLGELNSAASGFRKFAADYSSSWRVPRQVHRHAPTIRRSRPTSRRRMATPAAQNAIDPSAHASVWRFKLPPSTLLGYPSVAERDKMMLGNVGHFPQPPGETAPKRSRRARARIAGRAAFG